MSDIKIDANGDVSSTELNLERLLDELRHDLVLSEIRFIERKLINAISIPLAAFNPPYGRNYRRWLQREKRRRRRARRKRRGW